MKRKINYPMGSISTGTMRPEDLIPTFCDELNWLAIHLEYGNVTRARRSDHQMMFIAIMDRTETPDYFDSEDCAVDMETLFDMLGEYAGPYFYFGTHPGDGADYGYWLPENWDEDMELRVLDLSEIPAGYHGEVLHINDHGNCTLYIKTARKLTEVWAVV